MGSPDPLAAMRVPGRLSVKASGQTYDFSTTWPHGGTGLGMVRDVVLRRLEGREVLRGEEFSTSVEIVDGLFLGEQYLLVLALRGWDDDGVSQTFGNTFSGSTGGRTGLRYPDTGRSSGTLLSKAELPVLFTPDDQLRHPAVYFPQALPWAAEEQDIPLTRGSEEWILKAAFVATRASAPEDSVGRMAQVNLLEDLTA